MNLVADRRLEEKERRRSEIVDAAESVCLQVGIDALTMDEVARTARLSRALLYVYFKDKSDLVFALADRALSNLQERFTACVQTHTTGLEQVRGMGRAYLAFSQERPAQFEALARFELHSPEVSNASGAEAACVHSGDCVHQVMNAAIETGVRDRSIRADVGPPPLVSITLWGFMHGVIQLATTKANVLAHDNIQVTSLFEHALAMATRSLVVSEPET
ncbi:MAG: TetR/AcrR family transcriptional regulator [Steroidobacteraceae bacterium]|nr:TetR/AcrR family transcriptional regulator [Steroidobacteraceae bacterium]